MGVGELGDEMVSIEDRLITASLRSYVGRDKDELEKLFNWMAVWPEDVLVPCAVFDEFAPILAQNAKRPRVKVRSWLTALLKSSLCLGSIAAGIHQHDIVRHYTIARNSVAELRERHRQVISILCGTRAPGEPFNGAELTNTSTIAWYASTYLNYHVTGAIKDADDAETFLHALLVDKDPLVARSCVLAVGIEAALDKARSLVKAGEVNIGAHWLFAVTLLIELGLFLPSRLAAILVEASDALASVAVTDLDESGAALQLKVCSILMVTPQLS